jgi:hypothetical protein
MGMSDHLHLSWLFAQCLLVRSVGRPKNGSGNCGQEKNLLSLLGMEPPIRRSVDQFRTQTGCESRGSATPAPFRCRLDSLYSFCIGRTLPGLKTGELLSHVAVNTFQGLSVCILFYFIYFYFGNTSFVVVMCRLCNV